MTDTHVTLDQLEEHLRLLWYSDPGGGKTTDIADAARHGKIVYVDSENGVKARALKRHGIPTANIEPRHITTYQGMIDLHEELHGRLMDGEEIFAVAWDTASKTAGSLLDTIAIESAKKDQRKAQKTGKDADLIKADTDVYQDDYGTLGTQMRRIIRRFHGLPCHLLIACHQRKDKDDDGAVVVGPALSPAVRGDLVGYMDCVIHCSTSVWDGDEEEFMGLTRPRGVFMAKDRFGALPVRLVDPTFSRVLAYLDGELDRDKDPKQILARKRREVQKAEDAAVAEADAKSATEGNGEAKDGKPLEAVK